MSLRCTALPIDGVQEQVFKLKKACLALFILNPLVSSSDIREPLDAFPQLPLVGMDDKPFR
jgi:hypothetical protein